jgi:hypothetical protein
MKNKWLISGILVFLALAGAGFYFLYIRPSDQRIKSDLDETLQTIQEQLDQLNTDEDFEDISTTDFEYYEAEDTNSEEVSSMGNLEDTLVEIDYQLENMDLEFDFEAFDINY